MTKCPLCLWHWAIQITAWLLLLFFNIKIVEVNENVLTPNFFLFIYIYLFLLYNIVFAIHWHEFTMGVHVFPILDPLPPPFPSHPSGSSQYTIPEHLVSCIEPGLEIHFTYDTCFNAILPNHPTLTLSHRVQKTVLYICVSLPVLHIGLSLLSF